MKTQSLPYKATKAFNPLMIDYMETPAEFSSFLHHMPNEEGIKACMESRKDFPHRKALVEIIANQNDQLLLSEASKANLERLQNTNCFTICTAHQPVWMLGPLYFVSKILSTVRFCQQLKATFPDQDFVPIFWMHGGDHDFKELNHFHLFGDKITWEGDAGGPVGRMNLSGQKEALKPALEKLGASEHALYLKEQIEIAYSKASNHAELIRQLINQFLGKYGVLVIDQDDAALKKLAHPLFKEELLEKKAYDAVQIGNQRLKNKGYHAQAFAREINLFYLDNDYRKRIEFEDGNYLVKDLSISFEENGILKELESHPDRFSTNVILRPVYQETVLPNLAYVGGGGEMSYWLQLKEVFENFGKSMPVLLMRDSYAILKEKEITAWKEMGLNTEDLFNNLDTLKKKLVQIGASDELELLSDEKESILQAYSSMIEKAKAIDPNMEKAFIGARLQGEKSLEKLDKKIEKSLKQKNEVANNRLQKILGNFSPAGSLQERKENFMSFYLQMGDELFEELIMTSDLLNNEFKILSH